MRIRAIAVENAIRDSRQTKIEIVYPDGRSEGVVKLTFEKFEDQLIVLTLKSPKLMSMFDDEMNGYYVEQIKAFEDGDAFEMSLDPYAEQVDQIESRDNCVYRSERYEFATTKI